MKRHAISGILVLALLTFLGVYTFHTALRPFIAVSLSVDTDTDENTNNPQAHAAAVALAVSAPKVKYQVTSSTPQFVLLSFDGSKSVDMINETLVFQQKMQSEGKPLHFTYFINAAYFLTKDNAKLYQAPKVGRGISNIGFSNSAQDVALRVKAFNTAFNEGNEIGSHATGHFSGAAWTYEEWKQEFISFTSLMSNVQQNNPSQQIDAPIFLTSIHGFRAPDLGVNDNLYKVLGDFHFAYDASGIGPMDVWPNKDTYGIWHVPLGTIFVGPNKKPVVAMDYNLWKNQSGGKKVAVKGTSLWNVYFNEVETAYMDYFNTNYNGNRAPIVIGDHFSKWNDGVYWEAMKTFALNVCGQPQVRCVTFEKLTDYLNTVGAPPIIR